MSKDALQPPDPSVWQAQYLRLISFPLTSQDETQQKWWQELTGTESEKFVQKKREKEVQGVYDGVSLTLMIDTLRLQWTVAPQIEAEGPPDAPPSLGRFVDRRNWFTGLMNRWLEFSPPINRLAFNGVLLHLVENHEEGYRILDRYLRAVEVSPRSSDFLYRINRRVELRTSVPDLAVNRLTTWSVAKYGLMTLKPNLAPVETRATYACVLELDINTIPEWESPLPHAALPSIFGELVDLGMEIATKGDLAQQ